MAHGNATPPPERKVIGGEGELRLVPTELAALAADVSPATIRKWASRGKLIRYGSARRALYDLAELLELLPGGDDDVPLDSTPAGIADDVAGAEWLPS
jgi:hypothetical protein